MVASALGNSGRLNIAPAQHGAGPRSDSAILQCWLPDSSASHRCVSIPQSDVSTSLCPPPQTPPPVKPNKSPPLLQRGVCALSIGLSAMVPRFNVLLAYILVLCKILSLQIASHPQLWFVFPFCLPSFFQSKMFWILIGSILPVFFLSFPSIRFIYLSN